MGHDDGIVESGLLEEELSWSLAKICCVTNKNTIDTEQNFAERSLCGPYSKQFNS